jgi:hypothetical protein
VKVEEKFNKRAAALIEVQAPLVDDGPGFTLGVRVRLHPGNESGGCLDGRMLSMYLTPLEALEFAESLIGAARNRIRKG